jgi:hypothetical protein
MHRGRAREFGEAHEGAHDRLGGARGVGAASRRYPPFVKRSRFFFVVL